MKKYELTTDSKDAAGAVAYRIRALRSFGSVKQGQYGGYVESEANLSHEGNCWVGDHAYVVDNATVSDNAQVY